MWWLMLVSCAQQEVPSQQAALRVGYAQSPHAAAMLRAPLAATLLELPADAIVDAVTRGELDCGALHADHLLEALANAAPPGERPPWRIVARLDQSTPERPWSIPVDAPAPDAAPYERAMLRLFLDARGAELAAEAPPLAMLPLRQAREAVAAGAVPYPGFAADFADPGLSQTLLICAAPALEQRGEPLEALLVTYKRWLDYERGLPVREQLRLEGAGYEADPFAFEGLGLPRDPIDLRVDGRQLAALQAIFVSQTLLAGSAPIDPWLAPAPAAAAQTAANTAGPWPGGSPTVIPGSPPERLIAVLDGDGDGRLSSAELLAAAPADAPPQGYDLDSDGFVSESELRALLWSVSPLVPHHRPTAGNVDQDSAPKVRRSLQRDVQSLTRKLAQETE